MPKQLIRALTNILEIQILQLLGDILSISCLPDNWKTTITQSDDELIIEDYRSLPNFFLDFIFDGVNGVFKAFSG